MWGIMPRSLVTSGFFRIQMLITLGLAVLAALTSGQLTGDASFVSSAQVSVFCIAIAATSFVGSVFWILERRRTGEGCAFLTLGTSTVVLLLSSSSPASFNSLSDYLHLLSELSTSALLGAAMTGMLLGHWYLTAPTMSTAPLSRLTVYFGVAALTRLIVSAVALALAWEQFNGSGQAFATHRIWLCLRWSAGIFGGSTRARDRKYNYL